jgi:inositol oxygenase
MQLMNGAPLLSLDQWDEDVRTRYDPNRSKEQFRQYNDSTPPLVREFYRQNHPTSES